MSTVMADSRHGDTICTHEFRVNCGDCRLNSICLPIALEAQDIERLDNIIQRSKPLRKSDHIYRENEPFTSVYAVRSGSVNSGVS